MADYVALHRELIGDPLARGYAQMSDIEAARDLNTAYRVRVMPTMVTVRTLLARMDPPIAAALLDALTAAAQTDPVVNWAMHAFERDGIDVGHPNTRAQLDVLVAQGLLEAQHAAALKAVAERPVSRAVEVFGWGVSTYDVARARG